MRAVLTVLLLVLGPGSAWARTWHVFEDGSGDAPTIQAAIDSSQSGDVVLVSPGTYFEHIDFSGKDIHLVSSTGPESTIIDGSQGPGSVVTLKSGESRNAILEGFTIRGGTGSAFFPSGEYMAGGGIFCRDASPVIRGNIIRDNNIGDAQFGAGGALLGDTEEGPLTRQCAPKVGQV
jgi:hypothetical protein